VPVIKAVAGKIPVTFSIDTSRAAVAQAALDAGAALVNDITAARGDEKMFPLVAARRVPIVLMHMQGTPQTMQVDPSYQDVLREVTEFLESRILAAGAAGVPPENILLDPGLGFGKTLAHNLTLIREQRQLKRLGRPVVIGTSRKKFIGTIT